MKLDLIKVFLFQLFLFFSSLPSAFPMTYKDVLNGCPAGLKPSLEKCANADDHEGAIRILLLNNASALSWIKKELHQNDTYIPCGYLEAYIRLKGNHLPFLFATAFRNGANQTEFTYTLKKYADLVSTDDLIQLMIWTDHYPLNDDIYGILAKRGGPAEIAFLKDLMLFDGRSQWADYLKGYCDPEIFDILSLHLYARQSMSEDFKKCRSPDAVIIPPEPTRKPGDNPRGYGFPETFVKEVSQWDEKTILQKLFWLRSFFPKPVDAYYFNELGSRFGLLMPEGNQKTITVPEYLDVIQKQKDWLAKRLLVLAAPNLFSNDQMDELAAALLKDPAVFHPWVQAAACQVAALKSPETVEAVKKAIQSPDRFLRISALTAFGQRGRAAEVLDQALAIFFNGPSIFERDYAMGILTESLPDSRAEEALAKGAAWDFTGEKGPVARFNGEGGNYRFILSHDKNTSVKLQQSFLNGGLYVENLSLVPLKEIRRLSTESPFRNVRNYCKRVIEAHQLVILDPKPLETKGPGHH